MDETSATMGFLKMLEAEIPEQIFSAVNNEMLIALDLLPLSHFITVTTQ